MSSTRLGPTRSGWLAAAATALLLNIPTTLEAQLPEIRVVSNASGATLQVDGEDFMVLGMNWDYFPIGTTTTYNFWGQPDDFIRQALDREMGLLKSMGVNTIRVYVGIPPKWVQYIYERHGIFSVVNHAVGRYGVTLNGAYIPSTDYSDPAVREQLIGEVTAMVEELKNTPGVLMWLLGNENNYGLVWSSAETEALPVGERDTVRARYLYSLFGDVTQAIKEIDTTRPVAMANGDLQYIDLIAEEVQGLDVFGANVYRGISFGDLFADVEEKLGVPVMFTEFGADAFNARDYAEDQVSQARYLIGQWQEIYEQSAGKGRVGNSIGGMTFQWSDGWWKVGQEDRLDIQDITAGWPNDAYEDDYVEGDNNMNEEWWGIVAKGQPDSRGHFDLHPRAAFYALRDAYELDPYAPGTDLAAIRAHFATVDPNAAALTASADGAALSSGLLKQVRVSGLRFELETYSTGGSNLSTPESDGSATNLYPAFQGFDRKESFYADFRIDPKANLSASLSVNLLGNVPDNPIDEIFYENRGRARTIQTETGRVELEDIQRLKIYGASMSWDERWFRLDAFYRSGRYHWAYEGDFFNLYRESNYGPNIDIYNGVAPIGIEFEGKKSLNGLKVAFGPELWWGANPAMLTKYERQIGSFTATGIYQEDLSQQATTASSFAVPVPQNRKATLHLATTRGKMGIDLGGIWSGQTLVDRPFQIADGGPGSYRILADSIENSDTFGGKAKLTYTAGRWNWYVQAAAMGLVASGGGFDQTQTFTGWALKDSHSSNQWNVLTGLAFNFGSWQLAPNFLWQKPIVGPVPSDVPAPGRPRNILDDPFSVRANRETTGAELLVTYDPTPATWMYTWDSDLREDANFAASMGFTFRHHPTTQDAGIGISADGRSTFAFPGAPPARDLWEVRTRIVTKPSTNFGLIANLFAGNAEPNGDSPRLVKRVGGDARLITHSFKAMAGAKFNDWGPYDYHRDFNLTFPVQLMGDMSYVFGLPQWFDVPQTRFGIRGTWRSLDENSPRFCPAQTSDQFGSLTCDPTAGGSNGREWEIRTYVHIGT